MRWRRGLLIVAVLLHAVSWALPTVPLPFGRPSVAPGWLAFRLALGPLATVRLPIDTATFPLHPAEGYFTLSDGWGVVSVYSLASALTNIVFHALLVIAIARLTRGWFGPVVQRRAALTAAGLAAFNLAWLPLLLWPPEQGVLPGPGYFLWLAGFVALAVALGARRRGRSGDDAAIVGPAPHPGPNSAFV